MLRAEARQQLHAAVEAEFVALAGLNLAIGLKCGEPIRVAEPAGLPSFDLTLADCLQAAIRDRREFRVAKRHGRDLRRRGRGSPGRSSPPR